MYTDVGIDTGDMLLKKELEITPDMSLQELHDRLSVLGAQTLRETLEKLKDGTLKRTSQPDEGVTYAPMMQKTTGLVDWSRPAYEIYNLIRGTSPWPGAYTFYSGERMRICKAQPVNEECGQVRSGTILRVDCDGMLAATGKGMLRILELQFDSCKSMSVESYLCGHRINEGEILG
jgi:methionyl-tRNA formyltransferase